MIGRGHQSDFRLENGSVSRVHAVLKSEGETLRLEDRGSRNGTYVRAGDIWRRFEISRVLKTDRIRLGEEEVDVADVLKSQRKRPKIGGGAKAASRPKIGSKANDASQAGPGTGEKPLKKFVKPRRNQVTGDIEEGG